jgi:hypothetical protein
MIKKRNNDMPGTDISAVTVIGVKNESTSLCAEIA